MAYYVEEHYNELLAEFANPHSRTRRRLRPVYVAMLEALWKVEQLGNAFFKATPAWKFGGEQVEESWRRDLGGVQARALAIYQPDLIPEGVDPANLDQWCSPDLQRCEDPDKLAPMSWKGLVAGRSITNPDGLGAGPVPDSAMPAFLAQQIGILVQHEAELGQTWWIRMLDAIPAFVEAAGEAVVEALETATGALRTTSSLMSVLPWAIGGIAAAVLFAKARSAGRRSRRRKLF